MAEHDFEPRHLETLDRDLGRFSALERASGYIARPLVAPGIALVFILLSGLAAALIFGQTSTTLIVACAAAIGAYMALNIGANDVANNMGPAVGANALSMGGAILIAAIFESAGALIAGGDVVDTISKGIVSPDSISASGEFVWVMMAALLASALWVNVATYIGAPVSTTHAVVGGVLGSGVIAAGMASVNWAMMGQIVASWVISPALGGLAAAGFLWFIKARIIYQDDKIAAARTWVPVLIGVMSGTFAAYLALKGLSNVVKITMGSALLIGLAVGILTWLVMIPVIRRQSEGLENRNKSLKVLFAIPLVVSAALLSFAHGANDVANAVGPLAAIVEATSGNVGGAVRVPLWVMVIGAFGISFGLMLFGPHMIRMVGQQITKLNPMRAYCVSLSAAITVIIASWLGMPVSSTHIAIGAIFGVGFFREWDAERRLKTQLRQAEIPALPPEERRRRKLVRRNHVLAIGAAWVVTVPATGVLSALIFVVIRYIA
ncbi:inorganic phosphate transporter [Falsigemmobacter intermedius]|uniref:Phosphate transporter n=1 Tax=Falsigemmobacter intermedius TaxID=1553448 RepID=A0A444MD35_9RHOB|nr:inorganic phosphate transporter [Falsigemmobacter intermedius]RWY42292.1 inorganic phosphate transporter [Falsigemmobacter intermedius]